MGMSIEYVRWDCKATTTLQLSNQICVSIFLESKVLCLNNFIRFFLQYRKTWNFTVITTTTLKHICIGFRYYLCCERVRHNTHFRGRVKQYLRAFNLEVGGSRVNFQGKLICFLQNHQNEIEIILIQHVMVKSKYDSFIFILFLLVKFCLVVRQKSQSGSFIMLVFLGDVKELHTCCISRK